MALLLVDLPLKILQGMPKAKISQRGLQIHAVAEQTNFEFLQHASLCLS